MRQPTKEERIALMKNPTLEGALKFWDYKRLGEPVKPNVPLAGIHKARIL